MTTENYDIVPAHLAVKAMQDNGYKSPANAVAELIDNSIQAGATVIELLCMEETELVRTRVRSRIKHVAVLDNGSGMDPATLRMALQFGNGLYLDRGRHTGIGRFGMGLPCSSISQAQRVEVWTWQNGQDAAIYSFLDVDEISKGELAHVPAPTPRTIPQEWIQAAREIGPSGTLVVWSRLQRCIWRTARTIIENSELLIGRIYRKFISDGRVTIRMVASDVSTPASPSIDKHALPNDPLYLMSRSSCPQPFDTKPMFEPWGEPRPFLISYGGADHEVVLRFSLAKKDARELDQAGAQPHGKHAERNIGVSIVRADRELDLDADWAIKYDSRERWWGVELDFPPALDDLFGVTNNKQFAHNFSQLARIPIDDLLSDGKTLHQLQDEWQDAGDPRGPLLEIALAIQKNIKLLRESIREAQRGIRKRERHDQSGVEVIATAITKDRERQGHAGASDSEESLPYDERVELIQTDLAKLGVPEDEASRRAVEIVSSGLKYELLEADIASPAFFSVRQVAGVLQVTLNTGHSAYANLVEVLEEDPEEMTMADMQDRLRTSRDGLKLLLLAWARYEDELPDGTRRERAQETRTDWGRVARDFLRER